MTKLNGIFFVGLLSTALLVGAAARASDNPAMDGDVGHLEHEWARIKYQVKERSTQLSQIDALEKEAATIVRRYPGRAEPLVWDGIVTSEEAAMASIFTALSYAKSARGMFEKAEMIDPNALDGAVPMSLGTLYYRVPGFPVGFGDDDKARHYLEEALSKDPNGMDANYFYGDFVAEQGELDKAARLLSHALEAPVNTARPVWDAGRRAEIRDLLAKLQKKVAQR